MTTTIDAAEEPATDPTVVATPPTQDVADSDFRVAGSWLSTRLELSPSVRRITAIGGPRLLLTLTIGAWAALFSVHAYWRHDRFGTFDHDLGIWDQAVWLLAHGHSLITVRGLDVFGFHASPALYLLVPFYWLGAGPHFLNTVMVVVLALGAIPMFRAARHHLGNEWYALVLAIAFLVNYAGQWMLHETFHPEVVAVTPLLFAYLAAIEGRWRAFALWLLLAISWKEDIALAGLMLGFVLAVRGTRTVTGVPGPPDTRRMGVYAMVACTVWFLAATQLVIPAFSDGGNFTEGLFGDLGGSPTEIAETAVTDPGLVAEHLDNANAPRYVGDLTASFGFVPLLSPLALLIALPQTLINLLAIYDFFWTTRVHYAAMPLAAVAIAAVEGVARARRPGVRRFLVGCVAVGAFYTAVTWGISPASPLYRVGYWPLDEGPLQDELEAAVAVPEPDDAVSATYNLVPHLTHREQAYTFPNPWIPTNWGVAGENRPDPDDVDWIILEPNFLNDFDKGVLVSALTEPERLLEPGEQAPPPPDLDFGSRADPEKWDVIVDRPDLLIAHRIRE